MEFLHKCTYLGARCNHSVSGNFAIRNVSTYIHSLGSFVGAFMMNLMWLLERLKYE